MSGDTPSGEGFDFDDGEGHSLAACKHGTGVCVAVEREDSMETLMVAIDLPPAKTYEFAQWLLKQCALASEIEPIKAQNEEIGREVRKMYEGGDFDIRQFLKLCERVIP